jgi:hypothetical protein
MAFDATFGYIKHPHKISSIPERHVIKQSFFSTKVPGEMPHGSLSFFPVIPNENKFHPVLLCHVTASE